MTALSNAKLPALTNAKPFSYDRASLRSAIVLVGVGNFHRAHQAVYLDDVFDTGRHHDWAISGTGVISADEAMHGWWHHQTGFPPRAAVYAIATAPRWVAR
ncbi:MAG: hypothetical protein ETSY2_18870 [Candidatus Entotheonella gemina]|uniref:Uncharacterized protein n=1 Tax=Candidatus Entotheonella gemina TaxID=1429439 RepID=W4M948_9BACT|nr:MAG: hypothetical protein ETSY2_18870 [Candidatus Entotheonella gemina]